MHAHSESRCFSSPRERNKQHARTDLELKWREATARARAHVVLERLAADGRAKSTTGGARCQPLCLLLVCHHHTPRGKEREKGVSRRRGEKERERGGDLTCGQKNTNTHTHTTNLVTLANAAHLLAMLVQVAFDDTTVRPDGVVPVLPQMHVGDHVVVGVCHGCGSLLKKANTQ